MNTNKRQYFRLPLEEKCPAAILYLNQNPVECRLVETSLGGFALLTEKELQDATNTLGRLKSEGREHIVRIVHQEPLDDFFLIGMERLEEILPTEAEIPDSLIFRRLTIAAWGFAIMAIGAACYLLPNWYEADVSLSALR